MPTIRKRKAKVEKVLKTDVSPFRCSLEVIITSDMVKTGTRLGVEDDDLHGRMGYVISNEGDCIMVLNKNCLCPGLIAHDSAHVVFAMMRQARQSPAKGEETFCYILQNVVDFILENYKK